MSVNGNWNHDQKWHAYEESHRASTVISHLQPARQQQPADEQAFGCVTVFVGIKILPSAKVLVSLCDRHGAFISQKCFGAIIRITNRVSTYACWMKHKAWARCIRTLFIIDAERLLPLFVLRIKFKWNMCFWYVRQGGFETRIHTAEHVERGTQNARDAYKPRVIVSIENCWIFAQLLCVPPSSATATPFTDASRRFNFAVRTYSCEVGMFILAITAYDMGMWRRRDALEFFFFNWIKYFVRAKPQLVDEQMQKRNAN